MTENFKEGTFSPFQIYIKKKQNLVDQLGLENCFNCLCSFDLLFRK